MGAVLTVQQAVVAALGAGEALVDDLGVLVDENAHRSLLSVSPASSTALRAASSMVSSIISLSVRLRLEDLPTLFGVRAIETDHNRGIDVDPLHRFQNAVGHFLTSGDATERC